MLRVIFFVLVVIMTSCNSDELVQPMDCGNCGEWNTKMERCDCNNDSVCPQFSNCNTTNTGSCECDIKEEYYNTLSFKPDDNSDCIEDFENVFASRSEVNQSIVLITADLVTQRDSTKDEHLNELAFSIDLNSFDSIPGSYKIESSKNSLFEEIYSENFGNSCFGGITWGTCSPCASIEYTLTQFEDSGNKTDIVGSVYVFAGGFGDNNRYITFSIELDE